jgi:hypothetical protein
MTTNSSTSGIGAIANRRSTDVPSSTGHVDIGAGAAADQLAPAPASAGRYNVVETSDGSAIRCVEAPGLSVWVDPRHSFTEAEARRLGPRVVLLDGAGRFAPLIDADAQVYNLDHHQGCVRAFTLATCEQALVLIVKGVELDKGDWSIFANEPDLDTVLAIWLVLNHRRMSRLSDDAKSALFPLLRLEGAIDAHGTAFAEYCGIGEPAFADAQRRLDELVRLDRTLRATPDLPVIARCAELLRLTDEIVFTPDELETYRPIEEVYGHVALGRERVAVACRDESGIYEVESRLRDVWGSRLGVVVLENAPRRYTLRVPGVIGALNLGAAYAVLNWVDPAVERSSGELWGGADEIGGSPRERGSELSPGDVLQAIEWTYARARRPSAVVSRVSFATLAVSIVGFIAALAAAFQVPRGITEGVAGLATFGAVLFFASAWLSFRRARRVPWGPSWQTPDGWAWWKLAPFALVFGVLGGSWTPDSGDLLVGAAVPAWGGALVAAIGLEAWFRGWVHNRVWLELDRGRAPTRSRVSSAIWSSAALYAGITVLAGAIGALPDPFLAIDYATPAMVAGVAAFGFGVLLGKIREQSRSLWPTIAIQALAAAGLLLNRVWPLV